MMCRKDYIAITGDNSVHGYNEYFRTGMTPSERRAAIEAREKARRDAESFHRRTYEPCNVNAILRSLGKQSTKYTREMKCWRRNADGSASVSYVRIETVYEAYAEYKENAEW